VNEEKHNAIRAYYRTLFSAWGCQHWWPARSRFEMIVGAYLTQNTAWTNVEKALGSLRRAGLLSIDGIRRTPQAKLARLIRSSGFFRQKAQRPVPQVRARSFNVRDFHFPCFGALTWAGRSLNLEVLNYSVSPGWLAFGYAKPGAPGAF